jgi:hypothetical protein
MISSEQVSIAKRTALSRLAEVGIHDRFTVKLREPKNEDWAAMYRGGSQFKGRPIFWISARLDEVLDEDENPLIAVTSSLLHEYGHVIAEWAAARNEPMRALLAEGWPGMDPYWGAHRPWDEERFAEDFAQWLYGGGFVYGDEGTLAKIVALYVEDVIEPVP